MTHEEEAVERSPEFVLTLTGLAGLQSGRALMATATCRVSLAEAIGSLPNCLALLKLLLLSFFLRPQRYLGDFKDVQGAGGRLFLCVLAESRLSTQHSR